MTAKNVEIVAASGTESFIPLNKLKKSPNNARKTPHSEAAIEAYAASIAAKGILQNLVVEPELDAEGAATGFYFVTIGEGRRLAQLLRVKRKEIKKTEPIRCIIDTANDPFEISLDENVTRENMHPADQFEAFKKLAEERGCGAEEIAARFGVTPHVVRQRLRLGAVSPKLMQVYRDGDLTLDQLMAFAITEDHARQEAVYERLSYNRDASTIRRLLTEDACGGNRPPGDLCRRGGLHGGGRHDPPRPLYGGSRRLLRGRGAARPACDRESSGARQTPCRRPRAGNGRRPISTFRTATACAGPIRIRWSFRRKIRPPLMPRRPNSTA